MRKTRTRIGSSLLLVALAAAPSFGFEKKPAPYAVIGGTVYRPPGFALAGADVVLAPEGDPPAGYKFKKTKVKTSSRGEFAVRVPTVPMRYSVDVQYDGYKPQHRVVAVEGEQRRELSFVLEPAAAKQEAR